MLVGAGARSMPSQPEIDIRDESHSCETCRSRKPPQYGALLRREGEGGHDDRRLGREHAVEETFAAAAVSVGRQDALADLEFVGSLGSIVYSCIERGNAGIHG